MNATTAAITAGETTVKQQNWCYTAKAQDTKGSVSVENGANQSLLMAPVAMNIQPYQFTTPVKATEKTKELQVTRMMAFGRSFGEQSWS